MANYNTPIEYLEQAVNSILSQTYSNFELIIIDDASTDDSIKYLENIDDERIVLIKNEKNLGPAISRNEGIDIARGEYIAILDSDDISRPDRLKYQLDFMENNPEVIVCGSWFEKFGIENQIRKPLIEDFELYRCQLLFSNTPLTLCHSTAMIRKSMLDENNIRYDVTLPKAQDYGMWVVCSNYGKITILDKVLVKYRTHEMQISTKTREAQTDLADLVSRRQLEEIGVAFCKEEKRWRYDQVISKNDYILFYDWIMSIKAANLNFKRYDPSKLEQYLNCKLMNAVKRVKKTELIKIYLFSNKHTKELIRCLIKNSVKKRVSNG